MKQFHIPDPRALVREQRFKHSTNKQDVVALHEKRQDLRDVIEALQEAQDKCESDGFRWLIEKFLPADRRRVHVERANIQRDDPHYEALQHEFDGKLTYISELTQHVENVKRALSDARRQEKTILGLIAKRQQQQGAGS